MGDSNPSSDPQRDPVTDDLPDTASEQELDDLLAHANELAGDLAESVGIPDRSAPQTKPEASSESDDETAGAPDLDEELARLEGLANKAAGEIGDAESDAKSAESGAVDHPAGKSPAHASDHPEHPLTTTHREDVPDFMRDMMAEEDDSSAASTGKGAETGSTIPATPADDADAPRQRAAASATASKLHNKPKPGVVGTGMLGVVGSPAEEHAQIDTPSDDAGEGKPAASAGENAKETAVVRMARLAEPAALSACQSLVQVLERVDRPLGFLGERVRIFLGWVALATLGTAIIVYLVSLF